MNNKGFTLIEVLAVLVILSMTYLIAMPSLNIADKSKNISLVSNSKLISSRAYIMMNDSKYESYFTNGKIYIKDIKGISNIKDPFGGEIDEKSYILFKDEIEQGVNVRKTYIYIKTCDKNKCHEIGEETSPISEDKITHKDVKEISN